MKQPAPLHFGYGPGGSRFIARLLLPLGVAAVSSCAPGDAPEPGAVDDDDVPVVLTELQPELFSDPGAQTNAWADFDGDGDLDLFVGFRGAPNRLYENDRGRFVDVAESMGIADAQETRASAWGDFDHDGDVDLYVGFADAGSANKLYRNDGDGFVDVAGEVGVARGGVTRQPAFIDYDGDGDLDLFVAFRDGPNALFRNDGATFADATETSGIGDPRRTVGAAWFDMDGDVDLDVFVANQNGDEDGVFRNQGDGTFVDVAQELGMHQPGRSESQGSVGTAISDYDNDGDLDLFVASYGPDVLWENQGDGTFVNVAPGTPLAGDHHSVAAAWGDVDNDGQVDLYVGVFLADEAEARDYLFRNTPDGFVDATPPNVMAKGASHGVSWADFDFDGDVDLSLANNHADGGHPLYGNTLPAERSAQSLAVAVVDSQGRWVRAGALVTLRRESDGYVTSRIVDTGGGYASQSAQPVHFGLPRGVGPVNVTVSWLEGGEARTTTVSGIDPGAFQRQWLVLQLGVE